MATTIKYVATGEDFIITFPRPIYTRFIRLMIRLANPIFNNMKPTRQRWENFLWYKVAPFLGKHERKEWYRPNAEELGDRILTFHGKDSKHIEYTIDDLGNYWDSPIGSKPSELS